MLEWLGQFVSVFVYILLIVDPMVSLPVFVALTKGMKEDEIHDAALKAVLIAGGIATIFIFTGTLLLDVMRIDLDSFRIGGGIILGLLGIETVLGINLSRENEHDLGAVASLIATPMLTGPGLITVLMLKTADTGPAVPFVATVLALFVSWLMLDRAVAIKKLLGGQAIEVIGKLMGLFLVAIGVSFVKAGLGI
jgi:multiple antibiotic resistance protein